MDHRESARDGHCAPEHGGTKGRGTKALRHWRAGNRGRHLQKTAAIRAKTGAGVSFNARTVHDILGR
jgi:hypothetical protein